MASRITKKRRHCCEQKFDEGEEGDPNVFWFADEMAIHLLRDLESRNGGRNAVSWIEVCSSDPEFCGPPGSEKHHFLNDQLNFHKTLDIQECVASLEWHDIPLNEDTQKELSAMAERG